jgi:hypothetical protein
MKTKHVVLIGAIIVVVVAIVGAVWWNGDVAKAPDVSSLSDAIGIATSTGTSPNAVTTSTPARPSSTSNGSTTVSISIQKSYGNSSFTLNYPDAWSVTMIKPFSIDTFNGKYDNGGVIPAGGAVIDIATTTVYGSLQTIIDTETMSATSVATSTQMVNAVKCVKVSYQDEYAPGFTSQNTSLYCQKGTELWKIYFSYRANDPAAAAHISDFNKIIASLKFLP